MAKRLNSIRYLWKVNGVFSLFIYTSYLSRGPRKYFVKGPVKISAVAAQNVKMSHKRNAAFCLKRKQLSRREQGRKNRPLRTGLFKIPTVFVGCRVSDFRNDQRAR